ncbi:MAG: hypothetical protein IT201_12980 [Thermoleophilia bacterium]|nr:hypothetical protein [Thermoleophilia bacterium]
MSIVNAWEEERARLEDELARARRLAAVGQLAAGIAHDCNNLLTVIQGHSELIACELPAGHAVRRDVEEIGRAAGRAAALTRQLLTFASGARERERVDLNALVRGVETLLGRTVGDALELRVALAARSLHVLVDPGQFEQALLNLVLNARDATPAGGTIVVETALARLAPAGRDPLLPLGHYARLTVADTGEGMPPEVLERALEPFFTTKAPGAGTGLGLATTAAIVEQLGGSLTLSSTPGRGTTVSVLLPLAVSPA